MTTRLRWFAIVLAVAPWGHGLGCDNGGAGNADVAAEADGDEADGECSPGTVQVIGEMRPDRPFVGMRVGESRTMRVWVQAPPRCPIGVEVSAEPAGIVAPAAAEIPMEVGAWYVDVEVRGVAVGTATVRAAYAARAAEFTVDVVTPDVTCAGSASGTLRPGGRVEAVRMGPGGAFVAMPPDESLPEVDVSIDCAADIVPAGWVAIGPAVRIGPERRFSRELPAGIPAKIGLLPAGARTGDATVFFTDGRAAPRAVAFANTWLRGAPGGGSIEFVTPRTGTFQAAYEASLGTRTRTRRYTFRGIVGVSMGGGGASLVGLRNPERFDFVAPLGGPANWTYMLHYVRTYHLGGFCTAAPDDAGDVGERCPTPPPERMFEIEQEYENWFYPDGRDGQGGTFNRDDYVQIFRDMSLAFGNPGLYGVDSIYLPPGVPRSWWEMTPAERCASPVVLRDFHDDEYNPDGSFPVITFCEGGEAPGDVGRWDPAGRNDYPLDIALAVDVDGDTVRDSGEPVIRAGHEPYDDVGIDGVSSMDEPGYDPAANPDPAGDDFDYQFNPDGTERNWLWDGPRGPLPGEPWVDAGLDGVPGTRQHADGGYDWGEGNGRFDYSPNLLEFFAADGGSLIRDMPAADLDRIDILVDAGIRDLFVFAPGANALMGALTARGRAVRYYNDFGGTYGVSGVDDILDPKRVDFHGLGRDTLIRYGDPDAPEDRVMVGDGGHVGTVTQVINRLAYATFAMSARWPGGDRRPVAPGRDLMLSFDFTSPSTGRVSPVGMILPPGYHAAENASVRYPVVYFLHGYGQEPTDLIASAIIFQNWMISRDLPVDLRMQKLIMVFPDGRCRSDPDTPDHAKECLKGTFYADSVRPDGPKMETILLELMDHIDANYRTSAPRDVVETY